MKNLISIIFFAAIFCSCENPSTKELGYGYFLTHNSMGDYAIAKPINGYSTSETFSYTIYGAIVSFDFDSLYLIAAERPRDSVPEIENLPYNDAQRLFKQSNFSQYYILNKKKDKLYGPYTWLTFNVKRKEFNVSDKLNMTANSL